MHGVHLQCTCKQNIHPKLMSKPRWLKGWLCSHASPTDSRFQIHQNAPFWGSNCWGSYRRRGASPPPTPSPRSVRFASLANSRTFSAVFSFPHSHPCSSIFTSFSLMSFLITSLHLSFDLQISLSLHLALPSQSRFYYFLTCVYHTCPCPCTVCIH